jgi:hypothetical protein
MLQNCLGWIGLLASLASTVALGADGFSPWEVAAATMFFVGSIALIIAYSLPHLVIIMTGRLDGYYINQAHERDIIAIHRIATQHFGRSVTPEAQIRDMIRHNPNIFWVLWEPKSRGLASMIRGYFCLIPLSEELTNKIEAYEFDVTNVKPHQIPKAADPVFAIYIGGIVALTWRAKGQALGHVLEKSRMLASQTTGRTIYARAASREGLRLVQKHQFQPIRTERCGVGDIFKRIAEE